ALALAKHAEKTIATDINARAVALARANARLNGILNFEAREGDLFEPVAKELFDLVMSQPPFVPQPNGASEAVYMYGGRRGDELPMRALAALPAQLANGKRGLFVLHLPKEESAVDARLRPVIGESVNLLVFDAPGPPIDDLC